MAHRVVLVGCGNMGFAMLKGWLASGVLKPSEVAVVEPNDALRERAAESGVSAFASGETLGSEAPGIVILAVKPQVMGAVVPFYAGFATQGTTFVSVAAGTSVATIGSLLGNDSAAIIRCMPNTPAAIGQGMMVVFANPNVKADTLAFVETLLEASGKVATIDREDQMDAVTAVSGSGPAYLFHFIECLTAAGEKAGLPADTAKLLAMQTVQGAARLAAESSDEPAELRRQVTSPNGTTAAALAVFMDGKRLETLVSEAVEAARARSVELGKQ